MNDEPLLSVLVLAYNHESYIGECIDSFINSNYENLEIVVLDNGSSDRTFERVTSLKSNPNYLGLEILQAEHGNGVNSGLNLLLSKAQGDLVCFISGDDYTFSSRMSAQVQAFRLNSTLKACYGVPKLFEDTPKERRFWDSHERPRNFFQFSDMALKTLFSPVLGFECIEAGMSNPMVGRFSSLADKHLRNRTIRGLYCHSAYLGRKTADIEDFKREKVNLNEVVGETEYPAPKE